MDNRTIIQKSLEYIEDNLQTEITAAELAEMAGFSLFHYYRLFQQATGLPVMQYILRRRLLHGVYAMKQGSGKTEAALGYGFDTYAGFYRAFCREYLDTFAGLYPNLPRQIIHRDPNPGNIICGEDRWGFIDFELAERNARIYDLCYAATAVLSETFGQDNDRWLEIFRDMICGYDSVAHLTEEERKAIPYVILANQFVCVAWFAEQDQYAEIFQINRRMTAWLMEKLEELKDI